jgi:hypothetical protein
MGKMVGLARIKYQNIDINAYVTHVCSPMYLWLVDFNSCKNCELKLQANHAESYADIEELDQYLAQRICQAFEMSKFINDTSQTADLVIAMGDFNMTPDELGFRILKNNAHLLDSFTEAKV